MMECPSFITLHKRQAIYWCSDVQQTAVTHYEMDITVGGGKPVE